MLMFSVNVKSFIIISLIDVIYIALNLVTQSDCTDGDIRLVGGSTIYQGRVEVCVNRAWGTVCGYSWSWNDAKVVCNQIGAQSFGITCYMYALILIQVTGMVMLVTSIFHKGVDQFC